MKFSTMHWLGMAVLFLSTVCGQEAPAAETVPEPVILPVQEPVSQPEIAPLPVPEPDPVMTILPVQEPKPVIAPLPAERTGSGSGDVRAPRTGSGSGDARAPRTGTRSGDARAPRTGTRSGDARAPRTGSGSGDARAPRTGTRSGDARAPRTGSESGSGDARAPRTGSGSGSGDARAPRTGPGSGSGDARAPRTGSGSGDARAPRTGSGSGDARAPRTGSGSGDARAPRTGSGSGDARAPRTGSGSGDARAPRKRPQPDDDDRSPRNGPQPDDDRSPRNGPRSGDARSPRKGPQPDDDRSPRNGPQPDDDRSPRNGPQPDDDDRSPRNGPRSGDYRSPRKGPRPDDDDTTPRKGPRPDRRSPDGRLPRPDGRDGPRGRSPFPVGRDVPDDSDSPRRNFPNTKFPRRRRPDDADLPDDEDSPDNSDAPDATDGPDGQHGPRGSPRRRFPGDKTRPASRFPRRRGPARNQKTGDLKRVIGRRCTDSFSKVGCSYYRAKGMCASKANSHVRMAWTKCRKTCGLCKEDVPACLPGYRFDDAGQICRDVDECAEGTAACAANAKCVNKEGSYECQCNTGFVGNGKLLCEAQCTDASDTCAKYASDCFLSSRRIFMNKLCPVTCNKCSVKCAKGYRVGTDGKTCVNVNECNEKTAVCPVHSTCVDTKGGYRCSCNAGFIFNIVTQTCIEYSTDLSPQCDSLEAQCFAGTSMQQAWMAGYCPTTCRIFDQPRCGRGYKLSADGQCVDLDECSSPELNECAENANCVNMDGSYSCQCASGFKGNGFVECTTDRCYDLLSRSQCDAMARKSGWQSHGARAFRFCARTLKVCTNDDITTCSKGYVAQNGVCLDLNECKALTHKCPANSQCVNTFGGHRCTCDQGYSASKYTGKWECVRENKCIVAGDPHFKTFDGAVIQFQGVCSYTLAKPDPRKLGILSDFSVEVKNEHRDGEMKLSWVNSVKVKIYDTEIILGREGVVFVDGEQKAVPFSPHQGISISLNGVEVAVTTQTGLKVSYDGNHLVKVSVPDSYKNRMTGICGNLDGVPTNDYVTKEGIPTPSHAKIGNSWTVPDPTEVCQPATDESLSDCSPQVKSQVSGKGQCGVLKDTQGPFAECIKTVSPAMAFEFCIMDLCLSTVHPESLCRNVQAFADLCQSSGITVRWRSDALCPMACGDNSAYSPAMSACQATCSNPSSEALCRSLPVEGCACSTGMVRDGFQKCVPVAQCGCQLNGVYHATGDVWYDDTCAYKYTCLDRSTILMVPITCQTSGTCQSKDDKVACYCNDPSAGTTCDVESGIPDTFPNDPAYNPSAPILGPAAFQFTAATTTTPAPTTIPAYVPPHPDGEIADDEYFNEPPPPPQAPKARPLGVESGAIPNDALKPSSSSPTNPPTSARPNSRGGWRPSPTDTKPHLTVDLGKPMDVHGFGTLGHYTDPCWVTNYNVQTSLDGENFSPLLDTRPEFSNQPRTFIGNTDQNTWKKHCAHLYYGEPVKTRYVRFEPTADNGCTAMRVELYGFRDGRDPSQVQVLAYDQWTRNTSGCICYFDSTSTECACCYAGGCQCPRSNLHQCVQCGYGEKCGTPEIKSPEEQLDPMTISPTGCTCLFDTTRTDCACCAQYACQCGQTNSNQCVTCGHPEQCGQKEEIFGPNGYCTPTYCPAK